MGAIDCASGRGSYLLVFPHNIGWRSVPSPCFHERLSLGAVFGADIVVYLVVVAFGIERRVNVTKIDGIVFDKFSQDIEIIAVIEFVHLGKALSVITGNVAFTRVCDNRSFLSPLRA